MVVHPKILRYQNIHIVCGQITLIQIKQLKNRTMEQKTVGIFFYPRSQTQEKCSRSNKYHDGMPMHAWHAGEFAQKLDVQGELMSVRRVGTCARRVDVSQKSRNPHSSIKHGAHIGCMPCMIVKDGEGGPKVGISNRRHPSKLPVTIKI